MHVSFDRLHTSNSNVCIYLGGKCAKRTWWTVIDACIKKSMYGDNPLFGLTSVYFSFFLWLNISFLSLCCSCAFLILRMAGQCAPHLEEMRLLAFMAKNGAKKDGLNVKWGCQWLLLLSPVKKRQNLRVRLKDLQSDITERRVQGGCKENPYWEVLHGNERTVQRPFISTPIPLFIPPLCYRWVTTLQCSSVCMEGAATRCQLS